ncbi:DUF748 domain-containing protein [Bordetella sp. FB-8]|uniref:DUF748 domain-containing protein n=1 Tax=Bordetella sp. FB-8 TaxID=1159870 RepID=UPI00036AEA80|nr:DUF748 domain-containing protein [Bordetella sp. FB-8]
MQLRMPVLKLNRRTGKILLGIALALLLLAGVAAWQVPKLVRNALTQDVSRMLGRQVAVGKISFNPFTLTLRAHELTVGRPHEAPLLQVGEIDLSGAWRSLVMFAPVVDMIHIDQPRLRLVRQDPTHFNFSDIVDRLARMSAVKPGQPKPASTGLPRFSLNNMSLTGGVVSLDDRVTGRKQVIDQITLGVPFLSSFGYATHINVQPKVHLRINGSPLDLTGTARPFDKVPASTLNVVFSGLALEKWTDFWPMARPLPIKINHALLDSNLQVRFEQPAGAAPRIRVQGDLGLRQLDVSEASGAPLLSWGDLRFERVAVDLDAKKASIGSVTLSEPRVQVHRDARQLNWQRVADGFAALRAESGPAAQPTPARTRDHVPAAPAGKATEGAAPASAEPSAWKISVGDARLKDGEIDLRDDAMGLDYPLSGLSAEVENIAVPQVAGQPMHVWLNMDNNQDGSWLRARAPVVLQPLSVKAQLQLGNLALAPFAAAVRRVAPIAVQHGRLDLESRIEVDGPRIQARGVKLGLRGIAARDEGVKPAVDLSLGSLSLAADRLALDATPAHFTLRADGIQKQGTLALTGSLVAKPLSFKASVDLAKFDAASLAPFIASSLNATVRSVYVGARGNVEFAAAQGSAPMSVDWKGGVDVNDLDLEDRVNRAEFLNWKHLGLSAMHISMTGGKLGLGLGDILLEDFYGNILLDSHARLNVMDLMVEKGTAAGSITQDTQTRGQAERKPQTKAQAAHARHAEPAGMAPDISIDSVTLKRGRMTFNDHFVRPNYRAELSSIDGSLSTVSSAKPAPARVSITGRVYGTAPLSISGTVQPFSKYLALDIKALAKGVDLPKFTTYSSKYVGYAIQRGKLSVDLHYQIKNRTLQATNKVRLNQLTFGKPSNSPDALKLPVLLAVALLKDSNGNIDVDLPISGSLDDPQFSVGGIIVRVIVNTLVKAVTSPFKLLAAAFGGDSQDLSHIDFAPGSAALEDKGKSSIATLVKALTDRPALQMDIIGRADPQADRQGWVDDQMRKLKAKDMAVHGKIPDPDRIVLTDADRAKYLEKVYDHTNIKDKPRNFIGMAKSLPPDQMNALLLKAAPLDKKSLRQLADARAQVVYEQLLDTAPALADRVFVVAPKLDADGIEGGGAATRVDFALH